MMNKKKLSIFRSLMRKNNVATLEELVEAAKALEDIRQALD